MTTRPRRKRKGTDSAGEGTGETASAPPATSSAKTPVEPVPSDIPESSGSAPPTEAVSPVRALVPAPKSAGEPGGDTVTPEELRQDEAVVDRVEHLAKDVGWVLVAAGVIGIIMPGVLGTPFLIAGAAALWPGNRERFQRWREGHSPKFFHGSMKQINRFLDDLERRYPKNGPR